MSDSKLRATDRASRVAAETQVLPRLQRLAVSLGASSIIAAAVIGWSAYSLSRAKLIQSYFKDTLHHVQASAKYLATNSQATSRTEALAGLKSIFEDERSFPDSYLCVLGSDGKLLLHTRDPSREGGIAGDDVLFEPLGEDRPPLRMLELLDDLRRSSGEGPGGAGGKGKIGTLTSLDGQRQLIAFAYAPRLDVLVAIHVPWSTVDKEVNEATLPWAIGLGLTVLFAVPISLWGLSKAYADSQRGTRMAREAERRSAEKLRILREIDRAILSGQSVRGIVHAALARMGDLVRYHRASVTLFEEERGVASVLAVQSTNATELGPGSEVPIESATAYGFEDLHAGRTVVLEDLDAIEDLPAFMKQLRVEGVRSLAKVPLACRGELIGTLNLSFDRAGNPSPEDLDLAREVADVLALAVLQAQLRDALEKQAADLERRVEARTRELSDVNTELQGYVHSVSHDLRAPLRAVHGFGRLLLEEASGKLMKTEREYVERMVSASERMEAHVRGLLAYSRLAREDVAVRPLDTQHVVEEAHDLLQIELEERGASVVIVPPLVPVVGHHTSLVQAIANLLSNAAKFVPPGIEPRIEIGTDAVDGNVRLWIRDNGIGIPPAHQEKIFRMFERLNGVESYPGSGIGLAIVRRVVQRMGGTTGVESIPGQGSRFWIELPAVPAAVADR